MDALYIEVTETYPKNKNSIIELIACVLYYITVLIMPIISEELDRSSEMYGQKLHTEIRFLVLTRG